MQIQSTKDFTCTRELCVVRHVETSTARHAQHVVRVVSRRDKTSQVEFGLYSAVAAVRASLWKAGLAIQLSFTDLALLFLYVSEQISEWIKMHYIMALTIIIETYQRHGQGGKSSPVFTYT